MAGIEATVPARTRRPADLIGRILENPHALGVLMVTPAVLILAIFLAYPFGLGVWLGFTNATIGQAGHFAGLGNFRYLLGDSGFRLPVLNPIPYAARAVVAKLRAGMLLTALVNRGFRSKTIGGPIMLLP